MLKLKRAFEECGIKQKDFVSTSGYSKSLVSRVFTTGELPVDVNLFTIKLAEFAISEPALSTWLETHGLLASDLVTEDPSATAGALVEMDSFLEGQFDQAEDCIVRLAGEAAVHGPQLEPLLALAKLSHLLLTVLREQPLGLDEQGTLEMDIRQVLGGV